MKKVIFRKSIAAEEYVNKHICEKIKKILKEYKKKKLLRKRSNQDGVQTVNVEDKEIANFLLSCFADCIKKNYKTKKELNCTLNNFWINENKKGSKNAAHTHPESDFSGVYYVEVPKDSGNIRFEQFDLHDQNLGHHFFDDEFWDAYNIFNKQYQFLIFPSNYVHEVEVSKSAKARISVSFNVTIQR